MFKSFFGNEENQTREAEEGLRKGVFKILSVQIVYDSDESECYTAATCINEKNKIETINIEDLEISRDITDLTGAYIDYEEYEADDEFFFRGRIYR